MTEAGRVRITAIHESDVGWARRSWNRGSGTCGGSTVEDGLFAPLQSVVELACASSNCARLAYKLAVVVGVEAYWVRKQQDSP